MRTFIKTNNFAAIAFAAADKAAGANAEAAAESAPAKNIIEAITDEKQVAAINKALGHSRKLYPTFAEAVAAMTKAGTETDSFYGLPIAVVGYDPETDTVDESIYEGCNAALAIVGARIDAPAGTTGQKKLTGVKAVVIFPIPTMDTFLAGGESAVNWLHKIIEKEAAHVAFRNFRDVATVTELQTNTGKAPRNVEDYVTASAREGSGLDTDTFDALWLGLRNSIKSDMPALYKLLPSKGEALKAIRSASYAASQPELKPLEDAGVFAKLGAILIAGAADYKTKEGVSTPLDSTVIEEWLNERDTLELVAAKPEPKDFSALAELAW